MPAHKPRVPFLVVVLLSLAFVACTGGHGGGGGNGGGGGGNGSTNYTIGGAVSGLVGSGLILQNSGGGDLPVSANGSFTFNAIYSNGAAYNITVFSQPSNPSQTCNLSNGSGQISGANVTNIQVACVTNTFIISGTVSGLTGSGLVLQDNGGNNLPVSTNGSFTFTAVIASGSNYDVTVLTQPSPAQFCEVGNASGQVGGANVTNIQVTCTANTTGATVSIDWTNVHQQIDGFGAANAWHSASMTATQQGVFFGTGPGQLGLTLLLVVVSNGAEFSGDCSNVGASCAGPTGGDMQAVIAQGGRVIASPFIPPPAYRTNTTGPCVEGLIPQDYGPYATWVANFAKSVQTQYGVTLYAMSAQNEPDACATWTAAAIDNFVTNNLGPALALASPSTFIFLPETGGYGAINLGNTCATDSQCNQYVGAVAWHDYGASLSGTNTVTANPYPSSWPAGKKYWETAAACLKGFGPAFCQPGFNTNMTDALDWAAVIDQRIAVDGANAWLYWLLVDLSFKPSSVDDSALMAIDGTIAKRAYMMGQYSRFVRPGYFRIDATHLPEAAVSVSAYQDLPTNKLVVIATNYSSSADNQTFTITNPPATAFSAMTPWITSATSSLNQQASVPVSSNSFTYLLPPHSITTFASTP